jgi:hypothetical protein
VRYKNSRKVISYELDISYSGHAFVVITDAIFMPRQWVRTIHMDVLFFAGFHDKTINCAWVDVQYILYATI